MPHEHWQEAAAAYALDSLEPADRQEFEQHMGECADCRLAVQEFSEVAGLLVHGSPARAAPPGLRRRVTELVRADAQPRRRFAPRTLLPWLAAAAGITVAISAGLFAWRNQADARALQDRVAALADSITARDSVLGYLTGPEVHVVSLAASPDAKPVARVFWNHTRQRYIVTAFDLPPARPGRTYQLWAIAEGKAPVSMGTFDTDASGDAVAVLPVSAEIEQLGFIDLCAITQEPVGGSTQPTETPSLSGEWRHTD